MSQKTKEEKLEIKKSELALIDRKLEAVSQIEHNIFNPQKIIDSDRVYQLFIDSLKNDMYNIIEHKRRLLLTETRAVTSEIRGLKQAIKIDELKHSLNNIKGG